MAIVLKAIEHVWHAGRILTPGEVFSADESFAKKLIEGGSAKVNNSVETQNKPNDSHEILREKLLLLTEKELRDLAEKQNVELTSKDTTKGKIAQKLIDAEVILDETDI